MAKTLFFCLEFGPLEFICYLACLREAPSPEALRRAGAPAKAGACHLVLLLHNQAFVAILRTI